MNEFSEIYSKTRSLKTLNSYVERILFLHYSLKDTEDSTHTAEEFEEELKKGHILPISAKVTTDVIVNHNLNLVYKWAHKLNNGNYSLTIDDLISYGMIGLMKAIQVYNLNANVKFGTYATWYIKKYIYDGISEDSKIKVSSSASDLKVKFYYIQKEFEDLTGKTYIPRRISSNEKNCIADEFANIVIEELGITVERYNTIVDLINIPSVMSLNEVINDDKDTEVGDLISSDDDFKNYERIQGFKTIRDLIFNTTNDKLLSEFAFCFLLDSGEASNKYAIDKLNLTKEQAAVLRNKLLTLINSDSKLTTIVKDYLTARD